LKNFFLTELITFKKYLVKTELALPQCFLILSRSDGMDATSQPVNSSSRLHKGDFLATVL